MRLTASRPNGAKRSDLSRGIVVHWPFKCTVSWTAEIVLLFFILLGHSALNVQMKRCSHIMTMRIVIAM